MVGISNIFLIGIIRYLRLTLGGDEEISKGGDVMAKIIEAKERVDNLTEEVNHYFIYTSKFSI